MPAPGSAHKIYQLQGNQWAIICDDGTGYSFSGSQNGATEAAALLCAGGFTVTSAGPLLSAGTVTRGELLSAANFLTRGANGRLALRPGACAGVNGRMAVDYYLKAGASAGGSGAAGMAIDEVGMPVEKKDKKKGTVMAGSGAGTGQASAGRMGDCTVPPGRPGTTK